ncbi:hypothetical protein [Polluticaenibacter yanchengensis]|uniref:Uncharacterized protein n=1 Tax=Polluticaenibacter yanchengensis TaxID=3014562 RepID=A0ABT4UHQ6_9BACT|nr:hypothetical protein [Chitinophagaceae bacterium LY-5]
MKRKLHLLILVLLAGMGFLNAQNCYKTMSGPGVQVGTYLKTGGLCVTQLCLGSEYANLQNVIDDNIKSATSQGSLINVLNNGGIAVRNNNTTYPPGYVAGFLFTSQNLIEIGLFNGFIVETYLNGKLQESKTLANILSANLLTAGIQNFYLTFPTTKPFNEVRFRTIGISATILSGIRIYSAFAFNPNDCKTTSVTACNRPISGIYSQVSYDAPAVCAGCALTNAANINDGSSNNYATMYTTVSAVSSPSVGVLNTGAIYPAGYNAGFVVSPANGNALALVSVLNSISIETYLFGQLQERSTTPSAGGSGAFISIKVLSYNGNLRSKIGFTTSKPFNEIRYKHNQLANVSIGWTNVYYAYAEPGSCKDCKTYLGSSSSGKYSGALQSNVPGFFGLGGYTYNGTYGIALQSLNDLNNAISPSTTDYATYNGPFLAGLFAGSRVTVKNNGTQFPAGSTAGFIIQQNGSLLDLTVLNYITLRTYLINGSSVQLQEEKLQNGQLIGLDLIGGNTSKATIGFKTTKPFNAVQVDVSAGLATVGLGSSTYIYGAYAFEDADGDGYGDCEDTCPGGDDSMDSDGDGIPDDCDKCRAGNSSPELSGYSFTNVCPATGANLPDDAIVTVPNTVLEWHTVPEPTSAATKMPYVIMHLQAPIMLFSMMANTNVIVRLLK